MNIPENFDRWMFDYKEGNLSGSELQEFENFLIQNPEFEIEADAWENAFIRNEEFVYADAHTLEKDNRFAVYGWSAAAALLLLIGGTTLFVVNQTSDAKSGNLSGVYSDTKEEISSHTAGLPSAVVLENNDENNDGDNGSNVAGSQAAALNSPFYQAMNHQVQVLNNNNQSTGTTNGTVNAVQTNNSVLANGSYTNGNLTNGTAGVNSPNRSIVQDIAMDQELAKFDADENSAKYLANPTEGSLNFDISKKGSINHGSLKLKFKKFYRKIERAFGYPVGLKNLKEKEINLPQSTLLANNGAFAGGLMAPRFEMNYRNQWWGSDMNSQSLNLAFDDYSNALRGGYGVMVSAQDYGMGAYDDVSINLFYSPKIALGQNFVLEPAVKLTLGTISADANKLAAMDDLEINRGRGIDMTGAASSEGLSRIWYKDYGLSLMLNSKWFYAGFSADNLAGRYENVFTADGEPTPSEMPVRLSGIVGSDYENYEKTMTFSPFIAYEKFDERSELWGGFNYRLNWATVGGAVSTKGEFTASAGVKFNQFRLVYRYDRTQSQFLPTPAGSHNIGIRISGKVKRKPLLRN